MKKKLLIKTNLGQLRALRELGYLSFTGLQWLSSLEELDGDDYLFDDSVVGDIQNVYSNDNVWLTNGSFIYTNGTPGKRDF